MKKIFDGIMRGYDLNKLTKDTIEVLEEKKVLLFHSTYVKESDDDEIKYDFIDFLEETQSQLENIIFLNKFKKNQNNIPLMEYVIFDSKTYLINNKLIKEIYKCLNQIISAVDYTSIFIESIQINLKKFITPDDKKTYLKNFYEREFDKFKEKYRDPDTYLESGDELFFNICQHDPYTKEWENYILNKILASPATIKFHLLDGDYSSKIDPLTHIETLIMDEGEWNYLDYWADWLRLYNLNNYIITNTIAQNDNEAAKIHQQLPPLSQVIFIDLARVYTSKFDNLDIKQKLNFLTPLLKSPNNNEAKIKLFEVLIKMKTKQYDDLNNSELARKIHQITESSLDNIRNAIAVFRKSLESKKDFNEKDRKNFEKINKINTDLERLYFLGTTQGIPDY